MVTEFIDGELKKADCPKKVQTQIEIAVEEIFSHISSRADGETAVSVDIADSVAEITFSDNGIPCNPLSLGEPNISLSADDRRIRDYGIFLVKKMMDEFSYAYEDGKNVLTIRKTIKTIVPESLPPAEQNKGAVRRDAELIENGSPASEALTSLIKEEKNLVKNDSLIRQIVRKFLVSSVLSMVFLLTGSFIDTLIVGYYLGEAGLGAMSLISPVYLVFYTVGATLGMGGNISAGQTLGRGDYDGYGVILSPVWKYGEKAPAEHFHQKNGFIRLGERENLWVDQKGYSCVVCRGPCRCTAILYEKVFGSSS